MKYCRNCGHPMHDDEMYCGECGQPVNGSVKTSSQPEQNYHWAAICALVFGILGGWLAFVFGIIGLIKCKEKSEKTMCIIGMVLAAVEIAFVIYLNVTGMLQLF